MYGSTSTSNNRRQKPRHNRNMLALVLLPFLLLSAQTSNAEEAPNCETSLFHQLRVVEKTDHRLPIKLPDGRLKIYADFYEVVCPWQTEADINGDRKTDWIGIVGQKGKYSLIAYVSQGVSYKIHTIKRYSKFPRDTYINTLPTNVAAKLTGKGNHAFKSNRVIAENVIKGVSTAWVWDGKTIVELGGFVDETRMPKQEKNTEEEEDRT